MPKPDNTLDKILSTHLHEIKAGHSGKLRQAILQWVADEVIGENIYAERPSGGSNSWKAADELKNSQRATLREHGWEEQE